MVDRVELATISFALAGSVIAFLYYNVTPAKIFMGDTGSLLLGIIAAILAINFIEQHQALSIDNTQAFMSPPAVAVGVLLLPLYDTIRVFALRMMKGNSPFKPDRNHIHHLLLNTGLSHMQATGILIAANIFFILLVYFLQHLGTLNLLLLLFALASILTGIVYIIVSGKKKQLKQEVGA